MKSIAVKKSLVKLVAFWPYPEVKWNCRFTRHQARVYSLIRGQSCVDVTSFHSAIYLHCMSVYLLVVAKNRPTVELFAVSSPHITSHGQQKSNSSPWRLAFWCIGHKYGPAAHPIELRTWSICVTYT